MIATASATIIRGDLLSGAIFSSLADANHALGYADIGAGKTEVRYTLKGDTNVDATVDVGDLGALATFYGVTTGAIWSQGDFNYDGMVDVGDLGALATNYGQSLATGSFAASEAALPTAGVSSPAVP